MINNFILTLKKSPPNAGVFNPWWQTDPIHDINKNSKKIRQSQLLQYLKERQGVAKYLLLGEALGYQGGHFSGIAMTSERILLGGMTQRGVMPTHVFTGIEPKRTSKVQLKPLGFSEPTATIVWNFMLEQGLDSKNFLIWNAFPWHPFNTKKGFLSNRTPTPDEFLKGKEPLEKLIKLSGVKTIVAVGEKALLQLEQMGIRAIKVRHPANGGASLFRKQMLEIFHRESRN